MLGKQVAATTAILDDRPGAFPRDAMHQPQLEVPTISDSAPGLLAIMDRDEGIQTRPRKQSLTDFRKQHLLVQQLPQLNEYVGLLMACTKACSLSG